MFKKLKQRIESKRNSKNPFWKTLISIKDFIWRSLQKNKYRIKKIIFPIKLHRIDKKPIPYARNEIRLFLLVRNESLRLPYLLKYYSNKGVDRFFIIDNGSTDDSIDFLLKQDKVHIWKTNQSYKKNRQGMDWKEKLLRKYGKGYWCLMVDTDEIFFYPHAEKISIRDLCNFLDKKKKGALLCFLMDMYSSKPLRLSLYKKGENPLSVCPYFDKGHRETKRKFLNYYTFHEYKSERFTGGMRKRIFNIEVCLSKVPLFKYKKGVFISSGIHSIEGVPTSNVRGGVFHFKYLQDFPSRVMEEAKRGQYWKNAVQYKRYAKKIKENLNLNLYYPGSVKFKNSKQLVKLGIMKTSKEFEENYRQLKSLEKF